MTEPQHDLDDSYDSFPPTQAFQQIVPKGEVFWNYEASPTARASLRKKLEENSPDIGRFVEPPKALTPTLRLKARHRPVKVEDGEMDSEGRELINSIKELCDKVIQSDPSKVQSPTIGDRVKKEPEASALFDSDDDSFLLQCTQDLEQTNKPNSPSVVVKDRSPLVKNPDRNSLDDFDDEFNVFLSQVELPAEVGPSKVVSMKNLHGQTVQTSHEPLVTTRQHSPNFKRIKSADWIEEPKQRLRNSSGSIMKTWQRSNSDDDARKKCSKEEIEKKKQAAMKRKIERSQRS